MTEPGPAAPPAAQPPAEEGPAPPHAAPSSAPQQPAAAAAAGAGAGPGSRADRSKTKQVKKRGGARGAAFQQEISVSEQHNDLVRLVRSERRTDVEDGSVVLLSASVGGKAAQLQLSKDRLSVTGHKGYRTVRATHGVHQGAWYCEVTVKHLGATGHARVGWCTKKAEIQAPVGFDVHGFAYRDVDGSKVHQGCREPYGAPFAAGDVVGMLLHMPEGGRPIEPRERNVYRYKGSVWYEEAAEPTPAPLPGSVVAFSVNGVPQGPAFTDILEGTYYPAVSLYTMPEQSEGATVTVNFGPDFAFVPPTVAGCPPAQPFSMAPAAIAADYASRVQGVPTVAVGVAPALAPAAAVQAPGAGGAVAAGQQPGA